MDEQIETGDKRGSRPMTEQEIDKLGAGLEMNALIAEHVFGWKWYEVTRIAVLLPDWVHAEEHPVLYTPIPGPGERKREHLDGVFHGASDHPKEWNHCRFPLFPDYSGTWNDAGLVWEKMPLARVIEEETAGEVTVRCSSEYGWEGWDFGYISTAETLPLAVCRAALKAAMAGVREKV